MESRQIIPWRQIFPETAAPNESFIRLAKLNSNVWSELPLCRVALPPMGIKGRLAKLGRLAGLYLIQTQRLSTDRDKITTLKICQFRFSNDCHSF